MQPFKNKKGLCDGRTPALAAPVCRWRKKGCLVERPRGTEPGAGDERGKFLPFTSSVSRWEADMEVENVAVPGLKCSEGRPCREGRTQEGQPPLGGRGAGRGGGAFAG